ncbi:MAG: DUF294 nucleotidyltransferase-like domain-containing protein, partial [Bacteroidales bacterium]
MALNKKYNSFFFSIILPSIIAIVLFIIAIWGIILPSFKKNLMDRKKEMTLELVNVAWSVLDDYNQEYINGTLTKSDAQERAAKQISQMRYGSENKDYYWIIDMHPTMIMHPYRNELENKNLSEYKDPNGKRLFVEAVELVKKRNEGFIRYMWQWKDDPNRIVPKLSYVKAFQPWDWIIGTGIYIEDVKQEIDHLENRLIHISLLITAIIIAILSYVIRQSLGIENKRRDVEEKLKLSRQKYKSLVEASTEGTLMIVDEEIVFSNIKFSQLIGFDISQLTNLKFEDLFKAKWRDIVQSFDDPTKSISFESRIKSGRNKGKDVVLSVSKVKHGNNDGYIVVVKEVTPQNTIDKETENLARELETALLLMNQPIYSYARGIVKCHMDSTIQHVIDLMTRKRKDIVFVHKDNTIIGVINTSDLKKRVLAKNLDLQRNTLEIMSSPIITISENAFLYEALLDMKNNQVSHLGVTDNKGEIYGVISEKDLLHIQSNTISNLIHEAEKAEKIRELKTIHSKLPVLINALIEVSTKTRNITNIITILADAISRRIIDMAIEELGQPPCDFAFMTMGSEGRMEQTLKTDQDNAIVFEDQGNETPAETYSYFQKLGERICKDLNYVGYNYCEGNNIAQTPKWTQPVSVWKEYFSSWINSSDPQSILDSSIFFDFRCLYGKEEFIDTLRQHVNKVTVNKPVFFYHLAQSIIKFKPPLSIFGNIVGNHQGADENIISMKKILLPVTGLIRIYALQNKVNETNSVLRLKQLYEQKVLNRSLYEELLQSYNFLMYQRLRFQSISILNNTAPGNDIDVGQLTHLEVSTLKKVFNEISNFQEKLNFDF